MTLAVMQALLGFTSEPRWLRYATRHLQDLFGYLPGQSGYNKRLRRTGELLRTTTRMIACDTTLWSDDVWVRDGADAGWRPLFTAPGDDAPGTGLVTFSEDRASVLATRSVNGQTAMHQPGRVDHGALGS